MTLTLLTRSCVITVRRTKAERAEAGRLRSRCRRRAYDPSDGPVQPAGSPRFATRTLAEIGRAVRAFDGRGGGWQQAVALNLLSAESIGRSTA